VTATAGINAASRPVVPKASIPQEKTSSTKSEIKARAVMVERSMTYGEFAAQHGTDTRRLNELNGLDLTKATVLFKGAELYVPGKP
jgi:phage tail tape-measure protein